MPSDRLVEHFNIDNSIAVFESEDNKWYFGEVKNGYRHQDGCVSFRIDKKGTPQKANDKTFPFKGGFYGCGTAIPNVMLKTEYDFFASNPKQYKIWCDKAYNKEFNGKTLKVPEIKILKQT